MAAMHRVGGPAAKATPVGLVQTLDDIGNGALGSNNSTPLREALALARKSASARGEEI